MTIATTAPGSDAGTIFVGANVTWSGDGDLRLVVGLGLLDGGGLDRGDLCGLDTDLIRGRAGADGEHEGAADAVGVLDGPLERAGAAHRTAENRTDAADSEAVQQCHLGADLVEHGDLWEA